MNRLPHIAKKLLIAVAWLLAIGFFSSYPPVTSHAQVNDSVSKIINPALDTAIAQRIYIYNLERNVKKTEDSVRANIEYIKKHAKVDLSTPKVKVIYRDRIIYKRKVKKVPVHDTIYIPVDRSDYYIKSKRWSDSLAQIEHIRDSIATHRKWELKHRSIFQKIFGSKIKIN